MEDLTSCAAQDPEVFQRVWERVMGAKDDSAPVGAGRDGDLSCAYLRSLTGAPLSPIAADSTGSDWSEARPAADSGRLRALTAEALEGWQLYRQLARRTRNGTARALTALASDAHRQARRLSAAYFLLTGLRYWPAEQLPSPAISSLWGALREQYRAEEQQALSCRALGDESRDPALRDLCVQLADGCLERCRQVRALLEESVT